jgi:hypothetical protein
VLSILRTHMCSCGPTIWQPGQKHPHHTVLSHGSPEAGVQHACVRVCVCMCVCVCVCVCAGLGVRCRYMQEVVGFSYASLNQARHLLIAQLLNPTSSTQTIHTHTHPVSQPHVEISNSCSACIFPTLHNLAPISHSTVKMLKLTLKLLYITLDDVCLRWHWHT